ncbi:peptide chain release factor N(5)-glutamine methyltransferase [[Pseudomonas] carboxydohydrogena]|uniref:Release factor glutamine methyltransferase n=1 Tax=Afipia carboxydohydrogena TaxID=290 RepID=A0ABY8BUC2_AFICR|nr:peptide chain release factor N(5)-glutamine methyltransferase [[Pseudomonas] carboxydohydrogena]WEF51917.1 peptide chain release factor N(5)-glutamine methyltransferase [[Pseudomonas] carboxydohydrogena]
MSLTGLSLDQVRREIRAQLEDAGIESPELDTRLLLGDVLHLDLTGLVAAAARTLNADEAAALESRIQRRIAGEPVARILGRKEFWGLSFALSSATLVPRPDTETIVEAALALLKQDGRLNDALRIADIGTGSGAILLALLSELPNALGIGTDINPDALNMAAQNAVALGLNGRARFIECNYADALRGPFDLIVSNPPYIPSRDIDGLAIEVRAHDPRLALDGGPDGLDAYRVIAPAAFELLAPGGVVVLEIGQGQESDVARLMAGAGPDAGVSAKADLSGIPRAVIGRKPLF